jgi:hypothetical protein
MPIPLQPPTQPALAPPVGVRLSKCAHARLWTYAQAQGLTVSDLARRLMKTGWAVHFDGADLDMPLGMDIKLAEGLPGANGALDLPTLQEVAG